MSSHAFPHSTPTSTSHGGKSSISTGGIISMTPSKSTALVVARPEPEPSLSEAMGHEIVTISVGHDKKVFTVHKQLITSTSDYLTKYLSVKLSPGQAHAFPHVNPATFQLFIEYLYTRRIPGVVVGSGGSVQADRIRQLCQLSAFADSFQLHAELRNKIMDAIQEGFLVFNRTPEPGIMLQIYNNTAPTSKLRKFCAASLVFSLQTVNDFELGSVAALINEKDEIMDDFLEAVRGLGQVGRDPRIRACGGDERCVECATNPSRHDELLGFWPCAFHDHEDEIGVQDGSEGHVFSPAGELIFGQGCYLRRSS